MNDKPEDQTIATLNTGKNVEQDNIQDINQDEARGGPSSRQPPRDNPPILGIIAVIFGVISIFMWSIFFVPLALVLGVIALFIGQIGWGIAAIILSVIGVLTSPMIIMMLGLGVLLSYFGMPLPM